MQMSEARALYNVGNAYHAKAKNLLREERSACSACPSACASCACACAHADTNCGHTALDLNSNSNSNFSMARASATAAAAAAAADTLCSTLGDSINTTSGCLLQPTVPNCNPSEPASLGMPHSHVERDQTVALEGSSSPPPVASDAQHLPRRQTARLCLLAAAKYYEYTVNSVRCAFDCVTGRYSLYQII